MSHANSVRKGYLALLSILLPLGLLTKFYAGPGASWLSSHFGGLLYVSFWVFLVLAIAPHLPPLMVSSAVLLATCALEFLQLWHPPLLTGVRSTFLGHALLGSTFAWTDFPYYLLGAVFGYVVASHLRARSVAA
jgi:hypothetical protein